MLVAEKKEYMTFSRRLVVAGSKTATEKVVLLPLESVVALEYPSPRWAPWAVLGAGAAVAAGGLAFWLSGRSQMNDFEAQFAVECPMGCDAELNDKPGLRRDREDAQRSGTIGVTMMVAGGVVAVAGVVWAIINRPRRVLPNMEVSPVEGGATAGIGWHF